ncbi:MAG: carbohydrate ABC transporter permease [Proteobacteria bacterium]|nr:carbohydrate ABC transporter permease [Pseudomonadota bacterium]
MRKGTNGLPVFSSRLLATCLLLVPAVLHGFPIFYMLSVSFKEAAEAYKFPPSLLPSHPVLTNYSDALNAAPLWQFMLNSLIAALGITAIQMLTSILAAYALARIEFKGRKIVLGFVVAMLMVPSEITIVPNYLMMVRTGLIDTHLALIAPFSASAFGIFLLYQFFSGVPRELEEAATVDGASRMRFLFQILVPVSMPAIVAFGVFAFVSAWNQYLWPLVVTQSTAMRTVQVGVGMFRSEQEATSWGMVMAATSILVLPSIALFIATQKQFVRGLVSSGAGVKG